MPGVDPAHDTLGEDLTAMLGRSRRKQLAIDLDGRHAAKLDDRRTDTDKGERVDVAAEEIGAARARIEALTEERRNLGVWQRSRRKEVDGLLRRQEEAIARWETEPASRVPEVSVRQDIETPAVAAAELRASLADPPTALTARIGGRPDTLSEREAWCRAAANLMGRSPAAPSPMFEVDSLADLGPEL